jgi:hypothetical protein
VADRPTVVLLGESPPLGAPKDFTPFDCDSGTRLAKALGLRSRADLLAHVPRRNVFSTPGVGGRGGPKWDDEVAQRGAQVAARLACVDAGGRATVVSLGRLAAKAMGTTGMPPFGLWRRLPDVDHVIGPHPSGQSPMLNGAERQASARRYILPELVIGCPTLRPWHFDLDRPEVLVDLAAALSPNDVALGVGVLRVVDEVHRALTLPAHLAHRTNTAEALDDYRAAANVSMRTIMLACKTGAETVAINLADYTATQRVLKKEITTRAKAAAQQSIVIDYPVEVLRATIGRYVALGVL